MAMILVVDDDSVIRELLAAVLEEESDHDVVVASNGQEALERLAETEIDAIVCDVNMPVMDGIELVRNVRANPDTQDMPVLMISAAVPQAALEPGLRVNLLLEKPFEISALLACIQFVLDGVRAGTRHVCVTRRHAAAHLTRLATVHRRRPGLAG